ncbi:MAG TPA: type II secretion system F family protein [Burkholderiales bacterium]|nr:type II secretion system F family protein [Burkholderiales bacterium]
MPYFAYKGRNARRELVRGRQENSDAASVADQLFNIGITPIDIFPAGEPAVQEIGKWMSNAFAEKVKLVDLMLFSRQMYTLLKAGVPILRSLAGLQESVENRTFAKALEDIRKSLDSGRELSVSLRAYPGIFSQFYISMVRVGEVTGTLEAVFLRLFEHLEFEGEMRGRVKAALRYPMFVIITMAIALMVINLFVIPAFGSVYKGLKAELPLMTKILIGFSNFTVHYWPVMLVILLLAVFGFRSFVATSKGRYQWDRIKLRFPIAGPIMLKGTLARFARSFSLAFKSGVPVVEALNVVADVVENDYIAHRIGQMRDGVERGESVLRTAISTGVFTPVVHQMLAVGEETGELDNMMQEVAHLYEREVEYDVKNLSAQIEPILIIGLGVLVLVLALGVFLPIWDLAKVTVK